MREHHWKNGGALFYITNYRIKDYEDEKILS